MKRNHFFILIIVTIGVVIILYSMQGGMSPEEYAARVKEAREEKDRFMRNSEESPFANLGTYKGLSYFEPNLDFRITARLDRIEKPRLVELPTSDNKTSQYLEYAYAIFEVADKPCRLLILEITEPGPNKGTLFLAFADETSTKETYGAGRYLDLKKNPGSSSIILDFNEAYNPYCAYNASFSCPLPPRENLLEVAILAGEKTYKP
ncbi:MAG: DUF1684 domain-containing protein [Cyclobacteriaceae bacterium]